MAERRIPIERDEHVLRARRTAAATRVAVGGLGIALILFDPGLAAAPLASALGFAVILLTSLAQMAAPRISWAHAEEAFAATAAVLIVGLGQQRVTVLAVLWLVALATGVMARGGRLGWVGRTLVLAAMLMPVVTVGGVSGVYAAFCLAVIGLQLTSGRLTLELNRLLREARLEAENAETLLLAGDIAARVSRDAGLAPVARPPAPTPASPMGREEEAEARRALATLLSGEGLAIAVQPIVNLEHGEAHAYEALARFGRRRSARSPLNWFALADLLGERLALERVCLEASLRIFDDRPPGSRLAVNLSAASLLDQPTADLLAAFAAERAAGLAGLIVEITEGALVESDGATGEAIEGLRRLGAQLAVDDIGAGYSGLRQVTTVLPDYLKLDRSLCAGIDSDPDRTALVRALNIYAEQVGSLLVAEGVEHPSELVTLRKIGVPLIQGFLLGTPGRPWPHPAIPEPAPGHEARIRPPASRQPQVAPLRRARARSSAG